MKDEINNLASMSKKTIRKQEFLILVFEKGVAGDMCTRMAIRTYLNGINNGLKNEDLIFVWNKRTGLEIFKPLEIQEYRVLIFYGEVASMLLKTMTYYKLKGKNINYFSYKKNRAFYMSNEFAENGVYFRLFKNGIELEIGDFLYKSEERRKIKCKNTK